LIRDAIAGKYSYANFKPPWVSREEFQDKKRTDAYIACFWSFGNNQKNYIFGKDKEDLKRSMHQAVVFGEFDDVARETLQRDSWDTDDIKERRLALRKAIKDFNLEQLQQLERLQKLQHLQNPNQLQQFQQLEQLQQLNFYSKDYREVEILPNSVVYCDVPYKDTADYNNDFCHETFFDWAANHKEAVYFSEYACEDPRFQLAFEVEKRSLLNQKTKENTKKNMERVFWNGR
jgi:hypothetical protein